MNSIFFNFYLINITYIKSIIECIILGQTIGIVPAAELSITPFANITTYLNIPDCQGKESLFQAEMNRCLNQLKTLEEALVASGR